MQYVQMKWSIIEPSCLFKPKITNKIRKRIHQTIKKGKSPYTNGTFSKLKPSIIFMVISGKKQFQEGKIVANLFPKINNSTPKNKMRKLFFCNLPYNQLIPLVRKRASGNWKEQAKKIYFPFINNCTM